MKPQAGSGSRIFGVECFTLAWTAGLLAAFLHRWEYAAVLLCFGVIAALRMQRAERVLLVIGAVLGAGWFLHYDRTVRQPLFALDGETLVCSGTVTDKAEQDSGRVIYTLRTALAGRRVLVDWYVDAEETPALQISDRVTLEAELTRIQPDYRYHTAAYQAGFGKYLRIYTAELLDIVPDSGFSLRRAIHSYRARMTARIQKSLPEEESGLLCAMIFGDKSGLSAETRSDLTRTGIGHIAAVSGLHLVFFCAVLDAILRRLRLSRRMVCLLHIPMIAVFILLVDSSVSVYRAAVMVMLTQSAALFGRRGDTLHSLCLAMFFCTLFAPYVIGSVSFWLSVSGVFGIGVLAPYMTKHLRVKQNHREFLGLCCVSAAVMPASVLLCGESSLLAPIANLALLPLCVAALYIGFFLLLTGGLTAFLLPVAGILCRIVRLAAHGLAALPFSHLRADAEPVRAAFLIAAGALLLLLCYRRSPGQIARSALGFAAAIAVLSAGCAYAGSMQLRIAVLGGQKQAALVISSRGSTVVADLTDAPSNAQYVQRYLQDAGISAVDVLLLTGTRSASSYDEHLALIPVHAVLCVNGTREETLCGQPVIAAAGAASVQCGGAALTVDGSGAHILWNGLTAEATRSYREIPAASAAVIRYSKRTDAEILLPDGAGCVGNNLLLRLTESGRGAVIQLN